MGWLVSLAILRLFLMGSNVGAATEVVGSSMRRALQLFAITFSPHHPCAAEEREFDSLKLAQPLMTCCD